MNTHHFRLAVLLPMLLVLAGCNLFEELMEEMEKQQALEKNCTVEMYDGTTTGWRFNDKIEGWCEVSGDVLKYSNGKDIGVIDFIVTKGSGAKTYTYNDGTKGGASTTQKAVINVSSDGKTWEVIPLSGSNTAAGPLYHNSRNVFTLY